LIYRRELIGDFPSFLDDLSVSNYGQGGIGLASDIGLQLALPWKWLPTLSGVLRDVGNTKFNLEEDLADSNNGPPEKELQSLDVGFALYPIKWNYSRFTITGEYRDVLENYDFRFRVGPLEVSITTIKFWQRNRR